MKILIETGPAVLVIVALMSCATASRTFSAMDSESETMRTDSSVEVSVSDSSQMRFRSTSERSIGQVLDVLSSDDTVTLSLVVTDYDEAGRRTRESVLGLSRGRHSSGVVSRYNECSSIGTDSTARSCVRSVSSANTSRSMGKETYREETDRHRIGFSASAFICVLSVLALTVLIVLYEIRKRK